MSGGSPASSPAKSRLVEAICIHLCDRITQPLKKTGPGGKTIYTSRWRLVLSSYNAVRSRLVNSHALLEDTNLVLYTINETTLVRWYKNTVRCNEIKMLMQGLSLPSVKSCSSATLPPAQDRPSAPLPAPSDPHIFLEPKDTSGQAQVKAKPMSRTTEWRHRKPGDGTTAKRKYTCRVCGKEMTSSGHTQFRGQRYCPDAPGQISKEDWLAQRKAEAAAKLAAKADATK